MSGDKAGLTTSILRSVSRSFYLSIRILPGRLREPVAVAYLLARSSDTVADTAKIEKKIRVETLAKLSSIIRGDQARDTIADQVAAFAPLQTNLSERKLMELLPETLQRFEQLNDDDRADVRELLNTITQGQMMDLKSFDNPPNVRALASPADLDRYTYLVAGCVGEFWTRLGFRHVRNFATMSESKMLELGRHYGMGLQLVNILRDAGSDLRAGRCYFPEQELAAVRMSPTDILREPERFQTIYRKWIDKAQRGLESGVQYSNAIRHRRVRAASALPALIGARTIALLRNAGVTALHREIKVPRNEVRSIISSLVMKFASRKQIESMFNNPKV